MRRTPALLALVGLTLVAGPSPAALGRSSPPPATMPAVCGPGSAPETDIQGRVPLADHESGRADEPYTCNAELVSSLPSGGGFKVLRYVDAAGNDCAYYDTTLVFPFDAVDPRRDSSGVFVVDMADPAAPVVTDRLVTPAMLSPHESLVLNEERGILAAVMGNPTTYPGVIDLYDVAEDCRAPRLLASAPVGFLGHESGFSPDGDTLYAASLFTNTIAAIDVSDPTVPQLLTVLPYSSHGMTISDDGTRAYLASYRGAEGPDDDGRRPGLTILDVTAIDDREPLAQAEVVSTLTWPEASIPQTAIPVTFDGVPHLVEVDEFAGYPFPVGGTDPAAPVGAVRIIDIGDETAPEVISDIRLAVHQPDARAGESADDPGARFLGRGYAAHYCAVPTSVDPEIVACSMIVSGLRVFDIRDPRAPREIAYYNAPGEPVLEDPYDQEHGAAYAMSAPAFVPERNEIWYSDVASGLHVVRLTNGAWNSAPAPVPAPSARGGGAGAPVPAPPAPARPALPATGGSLALGVLGLAGMGVAGALARHRGR